MKRLFQLLPVLTVVVAVGCQRSNTPAASAPGAASAQPGPAAPATPAPAQPAAPGTVAPGTAPGQTVEAPVKPVPAVLPAVIATINGEQVQRWEVETALKQAETNNGGPVPPDKRDSVVRTIIDELVTYHLLAQEARGRKIEVSEAEVEKREKAGK